MSEKTERWPGGLEPSGMPRINTANAAAVAARYESRRKLYEAAREAARLAGGDPDNIHIVPNRDDTA